MEIILFIVSFLFVFGLLVLVHEFGHFIVAKISKVGVLEFGFGFPPAIYKKKIGETVYSINAIPFGGFVKLLGEDGSQKDNPRSLSVQSNLTKAKIISAGVVMNMVLAWFIFSSLYIVGFHSLIPGTENHLGVKEHTYIAEVEKGTPAAEKGILAKDEVLEINGKKIKNADEFVEGVRGKIGQEVKIKIKREQAIKEFTVIPFKGKVEGKEFGRIGVAVDKKVQADDILLAPVAGLAESFRLAGMTIVGLFQFFGKIFTFKLGEEAVGPVGIAVLTNQVRQLGFSFLLQFIAILSISLALLNIMPIPALDGGHLFLILIEKTRGRELSLKLKNILTIVGFVFLIALVIVITTKDLSRFGVIDSLKKLFGF